MSKKAKKIKPGKPQPEAAQLKVVERLIDEGDGAKAVQRLKPLIKRYPDHSGLRRLLVETLRQSQEARAAGLAAFEWAEHRTKSVPAQQALFSLAFELGHLLLADRAARRLRELGIETPGFPLQAERVAEILALPDETHASLEEVELFDIGKLHLDAQDFTGAVRWLDGVEILSARNHHAMALFHLGRTEESLGAFMAGWGSDPDNLFALGWAARLRLYLGDEIGAQGLTSPLEVATARRLDDALLQLDALLLLRKDEAAWDAFERYRACDWFEIGDAMPTAVFNHLAACAASRLGKDSEARHLWRESLRFSPDYKPALHNRECCERDGKAPAYPAVFDLTRSLPLTWINGLREADDAAADAIHDLSASNAFLEAIYLGGEDSLRTLVGLVLKDRAERKDLDAARLLRGFARLPIGTKEERFGFLRLLEEQHLIDRHGVVEIWDGGTIRQVKMISTEIHREPQESGLPDHLDRLLGESIKLFNTRDYDAAEVRLKQILDFAPHHPVALGNLAAVRQALGQPEEAYQLMRRAIELNPEYLFARCNLAKRLIQEGRLDEAHEQLKGLAERERLHVQDVFALYGAIAMLNHARGDHEDADTLIAQLEVMVEDEDDARRFAATKRLVKSVDPRSRFSDALGALVQGAGKLGGWRGR